ncbi:MAG TPA: RdgB/HAM1 family non-canonical purine NTP pyrophosphatase [Polyangia bacterium]|jgi:XTP/dITP diphosphohydrolase|nr:RdgB/HAM1 family non-canonical purine NTP pyrophosphatase [Polyangia bacterium]
MTLPLELVFATRNQGKLGEMRTLLAALVASPVTLLTLDEVGFTGDVEEDGATFADNARKKALTVAKAVRRPTLADDSGLLVDALGGAPGVHSARYAGAHGNDAANRAKLLEALAAVPSPRPAHFSCVLALARPIPYGAGVEILAMEEGRCDGEIAREPRGQGGFGYDPLFYVPAQGRTMAELASHEKDRISHRGQAMNRMAQRLVQLWSALLQAAPR